MIACNYIVLLLFLRVKRFPTIVRKLQDELKKFNSSAIPSGNLPWDSKGDPNLWDHTWNNFGDYINVRVNTAI